MKGLMLQKKNYIRITSANNGLFVVIVIEFFTCPSNRQRSFLLAGFSTKTIRSSGKKLNNNHDKKPIVCRGYSSCLEWL
jgi:hypothetical protein